MGNHSLKIGPHGAKPNRNSAFALIDLGNAKWCIYCLPHFSHSSTNPVCKPEKLQIIAQTNSICQFVTNFKN